MLIYECGWYGDQIILFAILRTLLQFIAHVNYYGAEC